MDILISAFNTLFTSLAGRMAYDNVSSAWTLQAANTTLYCCLSRKVGQRPALPSELILQIIDHPSRWICTYQNRLPNDSDGDASISSEDAMVQVATVAGSANVKVILSTRPLTAFEVANIRRLVFTFRSKDQGWSSYTSDHGTFRNTWSWFEAGIRHTSYSLPEEEEHDIVSNDNYERHELQRNRHATRQPESYRIELERDHPVVQCLKAGDVIDLLACAMYPGWKNIVYSAGVEVFLADDLQLLRHPHQ